MKKLISVLLVALMTLSLTACGSSSSKSATITYLYNTGSGHQAIAEYVQGALAQVGVDVQLENQEWATFLNTRKDGDYTIARNGWLGDYNDPISFLDMWTTDSGNNDVQFGRGDHATVAMYDLDLTDYGYDINVTDGTWSETYDVLINCIKTNSDQEARFAMMHIAEDMLMDTGCITPIYYYTDIYMLSSKVDGFYANPLGYKFFNKTTISDGSTTLPVCIASEPDHLDPALNSAVDGATVTSHLFSGLARWDDVDGTPTIVADCAVELPEPTTNEDGTVTYVFQLRDGLKWSDGEPLKASDFEYAWKRAASQELAADYGYMFDPILGYDSDNGYATDDFAVVADDDANTLTVTLKNYTAYFNELLAFPTFFPVRKDIIEEYGEAWATDPSTFVSNGMYTMSGWEHNSKITLTKNENYWNADEVTMDTIEFYLSDDDNAMLSNYKTGDWLLIDSVPNAEINTLKEEYGDEFHIDGQLGTYYICWNVNADLLGDAGKDMDTIEYQTEQANLRKAFGLVLDRNYVVEEIGQAGQVPASSFVAMGLTEPDGSQFYENAGHSDDYIGYYDVSANALESNYNTAMETISKYFSTEK